MAKEYKDLVTRLREAAVAEPIERRQLLLCAAGAIDELSRALDRAVADIASGLECCDYCVHSGKEYDEECDVECELCCRDCPCKDCRDSSAFSWKGGVR